MTLEWYWGLKRYNLKIFGFAIQIFEKLTIMIWFYSISYFDAWQYFYQSGDRPYHITCSNCQPNATEQKCFVLRSFFFNFKDSAVKYSSDNIKVLHSECNFKNNTSTKSGGSVRFACNSSFVQHKICSLLSQTSITNDDGGHHSHSYCKDTNNFNFVYDSSICLCGNERARKTLSLYYGNISIRSTNISKCTGDYHSGYGLYPSSEALVSLCTIENATCRSDVLGHNNYKINIVSFCNILNIKVSDNIWGIINCNGYITIENCSIFGNKGPLGFKLFSKNSDGSFLVKNCYAQSTGSIPSDITTENIKDIENYLNLSHLSTFKCEAQLPIANNDENEIITKEEDVIFYYCCAYPIFVKS